MPISVDIAIAEVPTMNRDERCVYVADSLGSAEVIVVWLGDQGVPAQVMNGATQGGLVGLTPLSTSGVASAGFEVWVNDVSQADRARQLLEEHHRDIAAKREEAAESVGPVAVVCEECGHETVFAGNQAGTTQDCQECGAYLDVPGPDDDDWGAVDDDEEHDDEPDENIKAR
jgi:hypothetical protein